MKLKCKMLKYNKRGLSPIFATLILATIVIIFGSAAYYYASNVATTATNQYSSSVTSSQQAISERVGFENIVYSSGKLTVSIINCGSASNLKLNSLFLYDKTNNIIGVYSVSGSGQISVLTKIGGGIIPNNNLNVGNEGSFVVTLGISLTSGSTYSIHLITQSGSAFDCAFTA